MPGHRDWIGGVSAGPEGSLSHRRIIERAGLKPWPKLWQNLRATRATEIMAEFPAICEKEWIGHSTRVALQNYAQVRPEDLARATGQKAVQNPVQ